jgi:predicted N-acetyltransferase YhbS
MRIRKFKKEDAKRVSNIIRKCLKEVNIKEYSPKVIVSLCNFFTPSLIISNSKNRTIFVAAEKGKVIGTASLKGDTVFTVFVDPKIHRKGVGSKLMDKVEELAKKKGYKTVKVPSSFGAFEFYKRRGYKKVKINHAKAKNHADTIEMKKRLVKY